MTFTNINSFDQKQTGTRIIIVRDLILKCLIGIHRHEKHGSQRVRINIYLTVLEAETAIEDKLSNVLCYEDLVIKIRKLTAEGHINLLETLAEKLARLCLEQPDTVRVRIRVEKLDVFTDTESVGIEIMRTNTSNDKCNKF